MHVRTDGRAAKRQVSHAVNRVRVPQYADLKTCRPEGQ